MRRTHFTVLLVCEGDAEDQLAQLVRDLYLPRNCGTTLQRRNSHGHGGAGALRLALELKASTEFQQYGVLVDTDQHWSDVERALAHQHSINPVENDPCIESVLLQVAGERAYRSTRDNKAAFESRFGSPANREGLLERHFTRQMFDSARSKITSIDALLRLIRC